MKPQISALVLSVFFLAAVTHEADAALDRHGSDFGKIDEAISERERFAAARKGAQLQCLRESEQLQGEMVQEHQGVQVHGLTALQAG